MHARGRPCSCSFFPFLFLDPQCPPCTKRWHAKHSMFPGVHARVLQHNVKFLAHSQCSRKSQFPVSAPRHAKNQIKSMQKTGRVLLLGSKVRSKPNKNQSRNIASHPQRCLCTSSCCCPKEEERIQARTCSVVSCVSNNPSSFVDNQEIVVIVSCRIQML